MEKFPNMKKNNNNKQEENFNLNFTKTENHTKIESYNTLKGLLSGIFENLKENNKNDIDKKTFEMFQKNINIISKKRHSVNLINNMKINNIN